MYYVPDDTKRCGLFTCRLCGMSFLDVRTVKVLPCPYCAEEEETEIGPDDEPLAAQDTAELVQVLEGEDVEKYDKLLSLALTGGDYEWI